ncbi:hypothetical protein G7084_00180 [Weissella coleopterorum]|uniref:Uncharacterized protein n=1 Tax=Weissella coleopterorum TaxID=2714949 RepID=A0A6G8AXZ2_9LACO|nr:hypothetical protein [Weissella coleopterorum]QIL49877.1 hypothetical protein G7084_00180 [Weissella coleopterorum]
MTDKNKVPQAVMGDLKHLRKKYKYAQLIVTDIIDDLRPDSPEDKKNPTALQKWVSQHEMREPDIEGEVYYDYLGVAKLELDIVNFVIYDADNFEVKTPTWVLVAKEKRYTDHHYLVTQNFNGVTAWDRRFGVNRANAIEEATRITDPHIKDMLLELNKDFEAIEVEE